MEDIAHFADRLETVPEESVAVSEPLLEEARNRFVLFPIMNDDVWTMYKTAFASLWKAEEVDLSKDLDDFDRLPPQSQHFLKYVLAFFATSDGIVAENIAANFVQEVKMPEARFFYGFQMMIENVHAETYALLVNTYIRDPDEKARLFGAMETIPCIKGKADWALKWLTNKEASFATRLIAFACVEGIFFSGSFCSIFWFKEQGVLPGLWFSNDLISRDEALHTDFAVLLYTRHVRERVPQEEVFAMVAEAVSLEEAFITGALPEGLQGMSADKMATYIQFVANRLLLQLGYDKLYPAATNPFPFMQRICIAGKTNFFENRNPDYHIPLHSGNDFEITEDF
jgi:ribonucleoside-diphosphate reductase beta chain